MAYFNERRRNPCPKCTEIRRQSGALRGLFILMLAKLGRLLEALSNFNHD